MALNCRGWIKYKLGQLDEAIRDFDLAIRYAPQLPIAYNNRGVCFAAKQDFDSSIRDYEGSLKITPNSPITLANLGTAWMSQGEFKNAKESFDKAIKLAPNLNEALNTIAWFYATCPDEDFRDGDKAVESSNQACELSKWKARRMLMEM